MGHQRIFVAALTTLYAFCITMLVTIAGGRNSGSFVYDDGDIVLNIVTFTGPPASEIPKGQRLHLTQLPTAELPIQFSRGVGGDHSASFDFPGLPMQLEVVDISTVDLGAPDAVKSDWAYRKNELTGLDYRARFSHGAEGNPRVELKGYCRGRWKGTLEFDLPKSSTLLVESKGSGGRSFFFALTPLEAIPLHFPHSGTKSPGSIQLTNISQVAPQYPEDVLARGFGGTVELWFYVFADGRPDLSRMIWISCPHPALARSVVAAVRQWHFVKPDGTAPGKELPATTDIHFEVRRH